MTAAARNELSEISRSLKRMAMEFQMPFLVLVANSRRMSKIKRKPNNGDIRENRQRALQDTLNMISKAVSSPAKTHEEQALQGLLFVGYDGPAFGFYNCTAENRMRRRHLEHLTNPERHHGPYVPSAQLAGHAALLRKAAARVGVRDRKTIRRLAIRFGLAHLPEGGAVMNIRHPVAARTGPRNAQRPGASAD